jgi:hypothetical protein
MDLAGKTSAHGSTKAHAFAAITVLLAYAALLAGCGPTQSTLVVHNRTNAPLSFVNLRGETLYVPACWSETFRWDGAWTSEAAVEPIPGALEVRIDAAPPADATGQFVDVVTADHILIVDAPSSLPPCSGAPPTSLILKVDNLTAASVWFESGGVAHYIEACGSWLYEWSDDAWTNKLTSEIPIPNAVKVQVDVMPPPTKRVDRMFVVITSDGTSVVETEPHPRPSCTAMGSPR